MTEGLIGLVVVVLAAAVVMTLVVRHRRHIATAAADRPRTVADLVRLRAEATDPVLRPVTDVQPAARPQPPAEPPAEPPAPPRAEAPAESSAGPSVHPSAHPAPERRPVAVAALVPPPPPAPEAAPPARSVAEPVARPVPAPAPAEPARPLASAPVAPVAPAPAERRPRAPGPDIAGDDTPWHRAALMAAGDGGSGTWQPPAPVVAAPVVARPVVPAPVIANPVPVPLRLVPPPDTDDSDADPEPDPSWTGWADWAEVDAEEAEEEESRAAGTQEEPAASSGPPSPEPEPPAVDEPPAAVPTVSVPTLYPEPEADPVALPLGRRTAAERAAEQAAADVALLRTFGYGDPAARPDSAPVVSMVRPDAEEDVAADKGAAQPVRFRVVRRDGATVGGAVVTLLDDRGLDVAGATADTAGRGEVPAPAAGSFVLVSTAPGHQPGAVAVTVGGEPAEADVLLARSASVSGAVHGEDGPIAGARVTLVQDGEVVDAVTTDGDGAYRIEDIGSGEYGLSVAAAGCVPAAGFVEVPDEADLRHDVVLAPASPVAAQYGSAYGAAGYDAPEFDDGMMSGQR